jgi:UDP-N-acetylglucosamine 3-dehydrogenase
MAQYTAAIIGCGRRGQGRGGVFGIGEAHAYAYNQHPRVSLVAAADINNELLQAFCEDHGTRGYHDYREMLEKERPDIVSVCTWPPLHAEMTVAAAEAGAKAIWCEKPMALSLDEVDRMLAACKRNSTYLQVNHLRRFSDPFQQARTFIQQGRIGKLERLEAYVPNWDLLSWGTHWVDMIRFLAGDQPALWVSAQIDCRHATKKYGHYVEDHSVTSIAFQDGVRGFLELGEGCSYPIGVRAYGTEGFIIINDEEPARALIRGEADWLQLSQHSSFKQCLILTLQDLISTLEVPGHRSLLDGEKAKATTEIILAAYESAYRSGRINLPLDVRDFPLARLVEKQSGHRT